MVVTLKKDGARYIVYSTDRAEAAERLGFVAKDGKWWNAVDTTMEHSRDFATRERAVQMAANRQRQDSMSEQHPPWIYSIRDRQSMVDACDAVRGGMEHQREDRMTEHTPGPWSVARPSMGFSAIYGPSGELVFGLAAGGAEEKQPDDVCDANARLIAAAPDLYEALALVMTPGMPTEFEHAEMMAKIRAALARARGEGR